MSGDLTKKHRRIETERLALTELREEDAEVLIRIFTDERVNATFMVPDLPTQEDKERFFAALMKLSRDPGRFLYGIYRDGKLIGTVNECRFDETEIELGYLIDPGEWGRGYATEILRATIGEMFSLGFSRIVAGYFEENPASRRVMEKAGMHPIEFEETEEYRDRTHRVLYCAVDRNDGI